MPHVKIGCSGFLYDHWKSNFYPHELPKRQWFDFYCKKFPSVELNVTFYSLPERETFIKWYNETPQGFTISLKGSRFITHVKKLKSHIEPLNVFFSRVGVLREKLGVVLWQLPPHLNSDPERLKDFIDELRQYKVKNTFEFRNETWINKKIISLLEKDNIGLCMADSPSFLNDLPVTAEFVYIRRQGIEGCSDSCYSTRDLKEDAKRVSKFLKQKKDVYLYFNNDLSGYAPRNAAELLSLLKK